MVFHYDRGRLLAVFTVNRFTTLDPRFTTLQSSTLKSSEILWLAVKKKKTRLRFNFYNGEIKVRRRRKFAFCSNVALRAWIRHPFFTNLAFIGLF